MKDPQTTGKILTYLKNKVNQKILFKEIEIDIATLVQKNNLPYELF